MHPNPQAHPAVDFREICWEWDLLQIVRAGRVDILDIRELLTIEDSGPVLLFIQKNGVRTGLRVDAGAATANLLQIIAGWADPVLRRAIHDVCNRGIVIASGAGRWSREKLQFLPAIGAGFPRLVKGNITISLEHARFDVAQWAAGRAVVSDGTSGLRIPVGRAAGAFLLFATLLQFCDTPDDRLVD